MNSTFSKLVRPVAIALLAAIFTALCVYASVRLGRLYSTPNYDDCGYFYSGALMLQSFQTGGLSGLLDNIKQGLHSPYSIILAAVAFAIFGYHYTAPYAADIVVVLAYLAGVGWLLRRLPFGTWFVLLIVFLCPPFITMGVVEFRPDIAWAVVTGFGVVFTVSSGSLFRNRWHSAVAGALMGVSLLIKPSTFVMTFILFSGAVISRAFVALVEGRLMDDRREATKGIVAFLIALVVVAGPYWVFFGSDAWHYFIDNSFGINKTVWSYKGSTSDSLLFYISGEGYRSNVGLPGILLTFVALVAGFHTFMANPRTRLKFLVLAGLIGAAWFINTTAQMKSPFLGGGIYGVWLFSCAWAIAAAYKCASGPNPSSFQSSLVAFKEAALCTFGFVLNRVGRLNLLLIAVALVSLAVYQWPAYSDWTTNADRSWNFRKAEMFMSGLLNAHAKNPPRSILFTQAGPIVMETTGLWFPAHKTKIDINSATFSRTEAEFTEKYPRYEWVILQEQGIMGNSSNMPSEALLPRFLEIVKADPRYSVIGEFTAKDGKKIWVYARPRNP